MHLSKPITVKKEVEDLSEVPTFPPSILQNLLSDNDAASEVHSVVNPPLFGNEYFKGPRSKFPVSSKQLSSLQVPATLILSTTKPPLLQVPSILPVSSTQPSSVQIPATLPLSIRKLPSLATESDALPAIDKVTKPKKRARKRYIFSKPKKRSKKKQELATLSLLNPLNESSDELFNKNTGEDVDSDGSSDTIILNELSSDDNIQLTAASTSTVITKPAELGRLLISGGTVKMLPNKATGESGKIMPEISSPLVKITDNQTEPLKSYENIPVLCAIKKELVESPPADTVPPVLDSAGNISFNKEMEVAQDISLFPQLNEIGLKKSGKKQTARRGRGKQRQTSSNKKTKSLTGNFVEGGNITYDNSFETTAVDKAVNLSLSETVIKEKPQRKKALAKRKPQKKNAKVAALAEINAVMQGATVSEELPSLDSIKSPKKPKRKKAATPRKSPKKKKVIGAIATETVQNSNISETISTEKRKRAPAKKKTPDPVGQSDVTSNDVVKSCLVLSVKKELPNADFQDSSSEKAPLGSRTDTFSENTAATTKPMGDPREKMIVSLSFEEDMSKEEEGEDKLSLLLAFRQRNSKGRFVKSPKTSKTFLEGQPSEGCSTNLPIVPTLANEVQNSKITEKALPLIYLSNFETTKHLNSDPLSSNAPSCALNVPLNTSTQEPGAGFPLNLNIKKELTDVSENNLTNNKSSAIEHPPKELSILNQHLSNQYVVRNPENITNFASMPSAPTTKRKQTARRGRRGTPAGQSLQSSKKPSGESPVAITTDTSVSEIASTQPPQTIKRKQTARRGRGNAQAGRGRTIEKPDNLIEKPDDFLSHLEPFATSSGQMDSVPGPSSTVPDFQVPKTTVSQQPVSFANISIKTEPKDAEYEVITLDDSPVKTPAKNFVNFSLGNSLQINFLNDNYNTATTIKKEIFTEQEKNSTVTSQHNATSIPLNIPQSTKIESSFLDTASSTPMSLRSISEAMKLINAVSTNSNKLETAAHQSAITSFSNDENTLPTTIPPFIKREIEDNSTAQNIASFPDGSPSFQNCLNSTNSRKEPQLAADNFPTVDNAKTSDLGFHNSDNANTSSKTLEEIWNLPGPSTDAVYSNTLSNVSRFDGYNNFNEQTDRDFQQTSKSHYASGDQDTLVRGHSPQDAISFSGVSIESLKNIIGNMDIISGTETKDASNSNSVLSNIDKDLPFQLDDDDTSSRTSSFHSRCSPRLSTPLSDSASLQLTDSVSPLTRVPMSSTSYQAQNTHVSDSQSGLNDPSQKPKPPLDVEDDSDDLKSIVALKLQLAASLPQNSIKDEGDFVPLENYAVVDGEVECFHKLLLAASSSNLTPKPLDTPPNASASPTIERTDSDLTPEAVYLPKPNIELNRTSMLDQFIMNKIAEDNSIHRGQNMLANHRVQNVNDLDEHPKQVHSPFNKNEENLKSHVVHPRNTISNIDLSLERFATRRSKSTFESEVRMEPSVSHSGERTLKTAVELDNYVPCLSEIPSQNNIRLNSLDSVSNVSETNYNDLPNIVLNKKPELDLSILPDMLKLISNLRESSSKTTTTSSALHDPLPKADNIQHEESNRWKVDNSIVHDAPSILAANSFESSKSLPSTTVIDIQKCSLPKNTDTYLDNQNYSLSSNNLINISLPSNELLYNVIKNSQLPSTDDFSCTLPSKCTKAIDTKTLSDISVEKDVLQLPQMLTETSSDLHKEAPVTEAVPNLKAINNPENVTASENYFEAADNLSVPKPSEVFSVESFKSPEEIKPASFQHSTPRFSNSEENILENFTAEPAKSKPIADKIDVAELLKILNTAKSMQSDLVASSPKPSQFDKPYNHKQANFTDSSHHDFVFSHGASLNDNRYSYQDNYRRHYPNYDDSMQLQTPIVHDYDHKSLRNPYNEVIRNLPDTNKTENNSYIHTQSKDSDTSDNDVDNEFINNESDVQETVHEDCIDEEKLSDKKDESAKDQELHDIPQYKSRWERIMERKSQVHKKEQISGHLSKDYYSAKVPKSKPKIQKPIAHVQPCSQISPKKKITENKVCSEHTGPAPKKKLANETEDVSVSGSPFKKKSKNAKDFSSEKKKTKIAEDISASGLPLKKNKSNKAEDISDSGLPLKKKKTNKAEDISTNSLLLKKKKANTTEVVSPMVKKSKVDKTINKKHHVKPKKVFLEGPSNLFTPDKIVKKKEVKYSGTPKDEDEASKRLYGRVTNRGSFLTESSMKQPPKSKALLGKKNIDKGKSTSKLFTDEFHSMISTPEIQIVPERDLLQKHSRKLTLESYKMKKGIFNDTSTGIMSPKMDFHSVSSFKQTPTSSTVLSCVSPDISFQASSDSSDFFSPPDPFDSNNPALPPFEGAKATFSRALLPTPGNVSPVVMKHSTYTKRPLLPDPVPSFTHRQLSRDFRGAEVQNTQFRSLLLSNCPIEIPTSPILQQPVVAPVSSRNRHSRARATTCICLPPKTLKASVGNSVFKTFDVMLLILEWNVDWLFQQQKNLEPPPISNTKKKVVNTYAEFEEYYNTYLPLLLLETWQRIYASWTHLHQASPYFCEITSYTVETHTIKVKCQAVFRSSDAERGLFPEEGNIIMIKFGTKEKGGIKILGYITHVKITAFDPSNDPQNTCYRTLKYTASEVLQRLNLTFLGAYSSDDFDKNQLIRIQVLCSIKPTLKQNDAMLNIKKSPLFTNIINPLNDGLRIVNVVTRNPDPLMVKKTVSDCVRDIIKGILSPHPLPLLTIAKSLPSSDRLLILLPLIEKMKHSYKTKVLLCTRTTKALTDIGFHLEGGTVKVVITGSRVDLHQKLRKYHLENLAADKASSSSSSLIPGFQEAASREAIESAKMDILKNCDVILSNIRSCHNDFFARACADGDCIPQMCCIIDEANLCTEPEILIPLLYGISKLILIGDPDVLAKVCSKTAINFDYNRSLFHRANDLDLASE